MAFSAYCLDVERITAEGFCLYAGMIPYDQAELRSIVCKFVDQLTSLNIHVVAQMANDPYGRSRLVEDVLSRLGDGYRMKFYTSRTALLFEEEFLNVIEEISNKLLCLYGENYRFKSARVTPYRNFCSTMIYMA